MTLLEAIQQEANPQIKAQIARGMGIEEGMVDEGIRLAAPLLLTASGDLAATTTGVERLFAMVRAYGDLARETVDAATGAYDDALVEELFGAGRAKVAATMHDATGFDLTAFLPIVAPLVMGALHNAVTSQELDAAGLASLVQGETAEFARAEPLLTQQIRAALDAGAQVQVSATSTRLRFDDAEWETLTHAPALAGLAVMLAAPSGPVGMTREVTALLDVLEEYALNAPGNSVVALASREWHDPAQLQALDANKDNAGMRAAAMCLDAIRILTDKSEAREVYEYQVFVMDAARRVAEAAKEGTFLGLGGTAISEEEQMMLEQISVALGYKP